MELKCHQLLKNDSAMQEAVPDDESKDELMDTLSKGNFTMRILYEQLANVQKMGSVGQIMSMIPGLSNSGIFDKVLRLLRLTSSSDKLV